MTDIKLAKPNKTEESFKEKIADLLEDMWHKIGRYHHGVNGSAAQPVLANAEMSESTDVLTYKLELPGMDDNDVEVEIASGRLIIRGEKIDERKETGANYVFSECSYGTFERSFVLPGNVDETKVCANFDKGVLTITVPYKANIQKTATKIEVLKS